MSDSDDVRGFVIGLFVGAAIGAAIGFLYAPKSGKETRALLREKALKAKDRAEDIIEEAKERAKKIIADAKGAAAKMEENSPS